MESVVIDYKLLKSYDKELQFTVIDTEGNILFNKKFSLENRELIEYINSLLKNKGELIIFNYKKFKFLLDNGFVFNGRINDVMVEFSKVKGEIFEDEYYSWEDLSECLNYYGFNNLNLENTLNSSKGILYCYKKINNRNTPDKYLNHIGETLKTFIMDILRNDKKDLNICLHEGDIEEDPCFEISINSLNDIKDKSILERKIANISIYSNNTFDVLITS